MDQVKLESAEKVAAKLRADAMEFDAHSQERLAKLYVATLLEEMASFAKSFREKDLVSNIDTILNNALKARSI